MIVLLGGRETEACVVSVSLGSAENVTRSSAESQTHR